MKFLIKMFPEIMIKSPPVRKLFIRQLSNNIRRIIKYKYQKPVVQACWDRIELHLPEQKNNANEAPRQKISSILQHIPGIATILAVVEYSFESQQDICQHAIENYRPLLPGKSFAVRVKRIGRDHSFSSLDIERLVGAKILALIPNCRVQLKLPEVTVALEIRQSRLFVIKQKYPGLGGYPLGAQDSVLSLVSGGFDSSVASYMTIKRGLLTHFCFFRLGGHAHEVGVKQVCHFLWQKFASSHSVQFVSIPFETVLAEIIASIQPNYMGVVLKRMMLRAAQRVSQHLQTAALVTGESVAQVSSQTLVNLKLIDNVTEDLVLRPLATLNKQEIIDVATAIGTEVFSKTMPEYCGAVSDHPTTRAKLTVLSAQESQFNFKVLEQALTNAEYLPIHRVLMAMPNHADMTMVNTPQVEDIIIDIRHPDEAEQQPLLLTHNQILQIPFYQLNQQFKHLDQDKHYLLYCGKGLMSQMHALNLRDEGFANIGVYQTAKINKITAISTGV